MSNNQSQSFNLVEYQRLEAKLDTLFPNFNYRPYQKEMILGISYEFLVNNKKYIILSAPTGSGKSWIARQVAVLMHSMVPNMDTLTLTKTISLQNQYLRDFPEMRKLMGAPNYECHTESANHIPPSLKVHPDCRYHKSTGLCEYARAKAAYESSPYKLLNYAFWMTGFEQYCCGGLTIIDEAHNIEESILDYMKAEINFQEIEDIAKSCLDDNLYNLRDVFPSGYDKITEINVPVAEQIVSFLFKCIDKATSEIDNINSRLESIAEQAEKVTDSKLSKKLYEELNLKVSKELNPLQDLVREFNTLGYRLSLAMSVNFENYTRERVEDSDEIVFHVKPIFCSSLILDQVFGPTQHVLFMSATGERIIDSLGLPKDLTCELSIPYLFPLENRPFYALEVLPALNYQNFSTVFQDYVSILDTILANYPDDSNIIIHSHSYKNAEETLKLSKYSSRMFIPSQEQVRELETVMRSGDIIVSPSITEGVDLGGNKIKAQIFLKVPYPYLGDRWVQQKMKLDSGWYSYQAMLHILQGSGRAIRGMNDKCDTYILDSAFRKLLGQNDRYLQDWFKETIHWLGEN